MKTNTCRVAIESLVCGMAVVYVPAITLHTQGSSCASYLKDDIVLQIRMCRCITNSSVLWLKTQSTVGPRNTGAGQRLISAGATAPGGPFLLVQTDCPDQNFRYHVRISIGGWAAVLQVALLLLSHTTWDPDGAASVGNTG